MDQIDRAQARQMEDMELTLAARRAKERGPPECTAPDCEEAISEVRRDLGARYCLHHQRLLEQGAKPWHTPAARNGRGR